MSIKLRELIRNVRACKTAAEERAVIAKECALIRTAFKSTDSEQQFRHRNVAKLLYIHMLGYPTHFGQMESLKLIASPSFPEKRIGYLGLMILLDEKVQVLMLVTNSLKNDFTNPNPYIVGLALCSLGNISSPDMARDLSNEVEKFFRSPNAYIRKKAALCAIRIIRKVPELIDDFLQSVQTLLNDKNHAVLLTAVCLIIEIIKIEPKQVSTFRKCVPTIVRLLKNLSVAGYVSEYDVVGITDPFLQVKCIQLLRLLGQGHQETSEFMNDVLAHVAINTEPTKNPGNAILYECVMTIMSIEAEAGLRVLAINILGRFLQNRDNNIRYVALNTLCKVVHRDTQAIQRHRNTVVDCLKDADISIRRRALDLIYALVTKNNVKALVKELLNYLALTSGDVEFKSDLTEKICLVVEKFAPNKHWHIDTLIAVLATAGNLTRENVATDLILLITRSKTLHAYSAHKLYQALFKKTKIAQLPLMHVATWCIGEYGDLLISDDGLAKTLEIEPKGEFKKLTESEILDLLHKVMKSPIAQLVTREYALNALIKLAGRFTQETERLRKLIGSYRTSMLVELQQRSCEYTSLYSDQFSSLRSGIVARMPVLDKSKNKKKDGGETGETLKPLSNKVQSPSSARGTQVASDSSSDEEPSETDSDAETEVLEDAETIRRATAIPTGNGIIRKQELPPATADIFNLDIFGDSAAPTPASGGAPTNGTTGNSNGASTNSLDMFLDVFGGSAPTTTNSTASKPTPSLTSSFFDTPTPAPVSTSNPLDFFAMSTPTPAPAPVATSSSFPPVVVFDSKGLKITFHYNRQPSTPETLQVIAHFHNSTPQDMTNFDFQVAVLKNVQLKMEPPTSTTIPANGAGNVTQTLTLHNTLHGKKKLLIRVKIDYRVGGNPVTEQAQISQFPD